MISKNISYAEATRSATAIKHGLDNTPSDEVLRYMHQTAQALFQPLREFFRCSIIVSSFYRSAKVNSHKDVGGSKRSQHVKGLALDLKHSNQFSPVTKNVLSNRLIFAWLYAYSPFDQLIWEYGDDNEPAWVHVSMSVGVARRQVLIKRSGKGYVEMPKEHINAALNALRY